MTYVLGVDGGGSTVRAAVFDSDLAILSHFVGATVNPSLIGRDEAEARIQAALRAAIGGAGLDAGAIAAVGLGIAGAAALHSADWLRQVVAGVLPEAKVAPSSDYEIALVGAHGERYGALALAGTGSLAYGVNRAGESWLAGAWGYLLGDEGSGYWLGAQALRAAVRMSDGRGPATALLEKTLAALGLASAPDLTLWLYQNQPPRARDVAALAPLVLACADEGDRIARELVSEGARELAIALRAVVRRLSLDAEKIAFTGSLLTQPNALSLRLCDLLGLDAIPQPRYDALTGAAILALQVV